MFLDGWVLASSPASDDPTDDGIIDDSSASEIDILFEETSEQPAKETKLKIDIKIPNTSEIIFFFKILVLLV